MLSIPEMIQLIHQMENPSYRKRRAGEDSLPSKNHNIRRSIRSRSTQHSHNLLQRDTMNQTAHPIRGYTANDITFSTPEAADFLSTVQDALYASIQTQSFQNTLSLPTLSLPGLDKLSPTQRQLLGFFECETVDRISTSASSRTEFCRVIFPIALQYEHVLLALLCLTSLYRTSAGLDQDKETANNLRNIAIHQLNETLHTEDKNRLVAALATSILLALGEIISPISDQHWNVFLRGASAVLGALGNSSNTPEVAFMRRMSLSLRQVTASTSSARATKEKEWTMQDSYICDIAGYSTLLGPVLEDVREFCRAHDADPTAVHKPGSRLYYKYIRLYEKIQFMLSLQTTRFRPGVILSDEEKQNLRLLNETFHHAGLLRLHACMHTTQKPLSRAIRTSVRRIIDCAAAMDLSRKPNPAICLYYPLYEACKHAVMQEDRDILIDLIQKAHASCPIAHFPMIRQIARLMWQ